MSGQASEHNHEHASGDDGVITCPFCGSGDTELFSLFGSSLLTSQYYCRGCRTAFERVKWGSGPGLGPGPTP